MLAVVVILAGGCASGSFERIPGQDEAERLIWNELYGMEGSAPEVEWFWYGKEIPGEDAVKGATWPGWKIQVEISIWEETRMPSRDSPIANSQLAHELMHYRTFVKTGDADPLHFRGDWEMAGEDAVRILSGRHL